MFLDEGPHLLAVEPGEFVANVRLHLDEGDDHPACIACGGCHGTLAHRDSGHFRHFQIGFIEKLRADAWNLRVNGLVGHLTRHNLGQVMLNERA